MLVQSKKGFLLIGETITGLMEEMVFEVSFEKWIIFRCREEEIIIITPIYYSHVTTSSIKIYSVFITLKSFLVPLSE